MGTRRLRRLSEYVANAVRDNITYRPLTILGAFGGAGVSVLAAFLDGDIMAGREWIYAVPPVGFGSAGYIMDRAREAEEISRAREAIEANLRKEGFL